MMMGLTVSQKPASAAFDLMQNCDLPPPSKVFKGSDKMLLLSTNNRVSNILGKQEFTNEFINYRTEGDGNSDVLEILKALRSSQTRAREAERTAATLIKQRDCLSNALMEEAMQLYAYRQQVRLLELQVSNLQRKMFPGFDTPEGPEPEGSNKEDDDGEERVSLVWILALALSWGIGVGTAIVCRYFL